MPRGSPGVPREAPPHPLLAADPLGIAAAHRAAAIHNTEAWSVGVSDAVALKRFKTVLDATERRVERMRRGGGDAT